MFRSQRGTLSITYLTSNCLTLLMNISQSLEASNVKALHRDTMKNYVNFRMIFEFSSEEAFRGKFHLRGKEKQQRKILSDNEIKFLNVIVSLSVESHSKFTSNEYFHFMSHPHLPPPFKKVEFLKPFH